MEALGHLYAHKSARGRRRTDRQLQYRAAKSARSSISAAPYARSAAVREFDAKHRDLLGPSLV